MTTHCNIIKIMLAALIIMATATQAAAQQHAWQQLVEQLYYDDEDETTEENLQELEITLAEIAANPININAVTRADLEQLSFLSADQIDAVLDYVDRYAPLLSMAELMMIPYLDITRRELLACLTTLGPPAPRELTFLDTLRYEQAVDEYKSLASKGRKGEVVGYIKLPMYARRGDSDGYYGYKYKHWLRANYQWDHVKIGAVAAQDAGEPFFANKNKWGYDLYTAFIQVQKVGRLKNLVVGHYQIKAGLGLIINNSLYFGKSFGSASAQASSTIIRPHNSRSESNYLQGAAATLALWRGADVSFFGSFRRIDATLTDSSAIRTIVTTGYHRTASELNRKHNATQTTAGAHIRYAFHGFTVGLTGVYNHYNMPLKPYTEGSSTAQLYRMFYPSGQDFWNISVNYGYKYRRFRFEGETATGDCGRVATVNSLSWQVGRAVTLYGIYRYYPIRFTTMMGQSFSEGGRNQNEDGLYLGAIWAPSDRFSLDGYTDIAYFPWARYQALGSSYCFDNLLRASYRLTPHSSLMVRYRIKLRQLNGDNEGELIYRTQQRLRIAYTLDLHNFTLRTQADGNYCTYREHSAGGMLYQTAKYTIKPLSVALGIGVFDTKDYASRVYISEESLPYTFASTAFYGQGIRCTAVVNCHALDTLAIIGKCGFTHYFDRDSIGTSYQLIASSSQTDVELMVRWKI